MDWEERNRRFSESRVLVVGDVMLDRYLWGQVSRISPESPVPVVHATNRTSVLGGAANVAANLAGLGTQAALLGVRGTDGEGKELTRLLAKEGIRDSVMEMEERPTITKTRVMAQNQQLLRVDEEEVAPLPAIWQEKILSSFKELVSGYQAVILSDYGKGVLAGALCRQIIDLCRSLDGTVIVDPKGVDWDRYRGASCIAPNAQEFSQYVQATFSGDPELTRKAEEVRGQLDLEYLLITRGAKGMVLVGQDTEPVLIPSHAREVYDVSGAGDTVIATLAAGVGGGLSWIEAAQIANVAAGIVVGKLGTQPIFQDDLENVLAQPEGLGPKVCYQRTAHEQVQSWRQVEQKVVFTNGCFDLLHPGHIHLLHAASREGNRLVVGLNSDASVKRIKGDSRPILNQQDRATILAALECVDLVVVFEEDTPARLIKSLRPDVLVKGADYKQEEVVGHDLVESWGGKVVLVPLLREMSTSRVVERIIGN